MDRNTLTAILLSTVVVILFYTFFLPKPQPPEPTSDPGVVTTTGEAQRTEDPSPSAGGPALGQAPGGTEYEEPGEAVETRDAPAGASGLDRAASESPVVVETEFYRAEFTNRGGVIRSWELKSYDNPFGDPVQLVFAGNTELGLVLESPMGDLDLSNTLFESRLEGLPDGGRRLTFTAGDGPRSVEKVFELPPGGYLTRLDIRLSGFPDVTGYRIGWRGGIPRAEKNPRQDDSSMGAIVLLGDSKETLKPDKFKKEAIRPLDGNVRWAGVRNKYFMAVVVPPEDISSRALAFGDNETKRVGAEVILPIRQGSAAHSFQVYLGPMNYKRLKDIGFGLDKSVDLGWKVFRPLSQLLLTSMLWLYSFIPNYGVVIIIISLLTKVIFYPLTKSSLKSMRAMQRLQPEMTALREKFKGDNQRLQAEMMGLYKKHKVNPVGGCLPIVVQMPVFFALYSVLSNSIVMRNAGFVGWINDLSSPDTIAIVGGFAIHVIPIILFGFTVLQQLLTPSGDPRQKMMGYMMPFVTLFIFYQFPAGLNLYWTVNSIMTVAQQWVIHREDPGTAPAASTA